MTVYEVWTAGRDEMEFYKSFASKDEAISFADDLRRNGTIGTISVYEISKIYGA